MTKNICVAIDGPAGAGKSTVAKLIALRFGLQYVDTGAMYRGVALRALRMGAEIDNPQHVEPIANRASFRFHAEIPSPGELLNRVFVDGEDVTDDIRAPDVSNAASVVSTLSGVRRALVALQQRMGADGGVVMEGRDIGTVVMPRAEVKIFLTASAEERARRRCLELELKGAPQPYQQVLDEINERDHRDTTRADSPLRPAEDAVTVDTDGKSIEQVTDEIGSIINRRME